MYPLLVWVQEMFQEAANYSASSEIGKSILVADRISAVAKDHPQGPLFDPIRLWLVPAKLSLGVVDWEVEVLDRITFKETPYRWSVATWLRGYKGVGTPIRGWTGVEAVTWSSIVSSPTNPLGIEVFREANSKLVTGRLKEKGIDIFPLPADAPEVLAVYSSANINRPQFYPGGTRNDYSSFGQILKKAA